MKLPDRPDLSRLPWQRAARLGPVLAWGVALAVTAWVAADLFWRFTAPRPPALPVASLADPQQAAQAIATRHLMGQGPAAGSPTQVAAPGRYTVQAVVTGAAGRPGWAIVAIDGGAQQGVVEGQEIRPGVTLSRVRADGIELTVGGARETVALAERSSAAPGTEHAAPPALNLSSPPPASADAPTPAMPGLPAGFPANLQAQPQTLPSPSNQ